MKRYVFICSGLIIFMLYMSTASATQYTGLDGWLDLISDFITDFWAFFDTDFPEFVIRFYAWAIEWATLLKLKLELQSIQFAWLVAKQILENFQVGSRIAAAASALPVDMQSALMDMRIFDGFNLIINAYVTRYVMRFI
ncbi:hypothetical protein N473_04700 [Pseudoalteromonas luteoviolacea CPMOR-1]|uniref:DUF2523 domain-containing protein n=1 Tax=Pseudoalteromonas luteoviolacea CPMOR-1 TaxID=1365248 RepID=A0A161YEV8_9GAMM|nr:DUF2523 family protein [Pseudoalteromonas luteoviolacea]KZN58737.1 hypothetical protein N473_04700 [Pseudoalteromonas luteoviolacea CPMOR-1]